MTGGWPPAPASQPSTFSAEQGWLDPFLMGLLLRKKSMVNVGHFRHYMDKQRRLEAWCTMFCVDSDPVAEQHLSAVNLLFMASMEICEVLGWLQSWTVIKFSGLKLWTLVSSLHHNFFSWEDQGLGIKVHPRAIFLEPRAGVTLLIRDINTYIRFGFHHLFRCYQLCIKVK